MALDAVIFDLDLTLIASAAAEAHRRRREWSAVYPLIPRLQPYEGIPDLIGRLNKRGVKVAIVTSSPSSYCSRVIQHWEWKVTTTVCYHDTPQRKPHPAPMLKALEKLGVTAASTIAVGDAVGDIVSAKGAGVLAVAALWGLSDSSPLLAEKPDIVCATVEELKQYIDSRLGN